MTLRWSRITEEFVRWTVAPTDPSGSPVSIAGVDAALLPYRSQGPTSSTVWKAAVYTAPSGSNPGSAKILISGPDANDPGNAGFRFASTDWGGDLWARVTDNPEVDPEFIERIDLHQD